MWSFGKLGKASSYKSLEDQSSERYIIHTIWKILSTLSTLLLLCGFLLLPTTFDTDTHLRMSITVIIVLVVLLITAGYSLMAFCWLKCTSVIFRLETILLPGFASCVLGFVALVWALISTTGRYDTAKAGFPISLAVTLFSAIGFGGLAILCQRSINVMARVGHASNGSNGGAGWRGLNGSGVYAPLTDPSSTSFHQASNPTTRTFYDAAAYSSAMNYPISITSPTSQQQAPHVAVSNPSTLINQPSNSSLNTTAIPPTHATPEPIRPTSFTITQSPFAVPRSEDELVAQQMARLLAAGREADATTGQAAAKSSSQSTFHIEWPNADMDDEFEVEDTSSGRQRANSDGSRTQFLAPPEEVSEDGRTRRSSSSNGRAVSAADVRGRQQRRTREEVRERQRSRDERRIEIEMSGLQMQGAKGTETAQLGATSSPPPPAPS